GFQPFDDEDASDFDAVSDVFDGHLAYTTQGPMRLGFTLDGDYQRYHLVGSLDGSYDEPPLRTGRTFGGGVTLASEQSERLAYDLRADFASSDFAMGEDDLGLTEARLGAGGALRHARFRLDAGGSLAGLGDEGL